MKRLLLLIALVWTTWSWAKPFRYAEDQAPGIVNPISATTMSEARINELVFESLYADDQQLRMRRYWPNLMRLRPTVCR